MSNPVGSARQLARRPEESERAARDGSDLVQVAGVYLGLSQLVIVQAMAYLQRFYLTHSRSDYPVYNLAHAALLTSVKLHELHDSVSSARISKVLNFVAGHVTMPFEADNEVPPGSDYEMELLAGLNFDTEVLLPHSLVLSYMQLLELQTLPGLAQSTWAYLNDAVRTTDLVVIHHPNVIAVAAVSLAAASLNITLSKSQWWLLFDVQTEDLNHAVSLIAYGISQNKLQLLSPSSEDEAR